MAEPTFALVLWSDGRKSAVNRKKIVSGEAAPGQEVVVKWKGGRRYAAKVIEIGETNKLASKQLL